MAELRLDEAYRTAKLVAGKNRYFLQGMSGMSAEDLIQELVIDYAQHAQKYDPDRATLGAYMAVRMRSKVLNLVRHYSAARRAPRDPYGRLNPLSAVPAVGVDMASFGKAAPDMARIIDLRRAMDESGQAWTDLVSSLAEDDTSTQQIRIVAAMHALRGRKHVPEAATEPQLPDCHALGQFPEGYDVADVLCQNCPLKYECLPEARKKKLIDTPIDADTEVAAVLRGLVTIEQMVERQYTRARLLEGNHAVPPSMLHNSPDVLTAPPVAVPSTPAPAPEPLPAGVQVAVTIRKAKRPPQGAPQCVDPANLTVDTKEQVFFYGLLIARLGRSSDGWGWFSADGANESDGWYAKKAAALADLRSADCTTSLIAKAVKARFPFSAKPSKKPGPPVPEPKEDDGEGWPMTSGDRPCPTPKPFKSDAQRENTFDKLHRSLGTAIRLKPGHRLVRRQRNGKECVVEVRKNGFAYDVGEQTAKACGFTSSVQVFRSLSAVAQWHTRRQTSGNAYFHLQLSQTCIEDSKGNLLDGRGAV